MQPERWQQVKRLAYEALERDTGERTTWLADACAGDQSLKTEVESILAHHAQAPDLLEAPACESFAEFRHVGKADRRIGQRVGAYELERLIGSGGMGDVFLGKRFDGEFEQRVAIKLIRRGMETDDLVRRFYDERRTLAGLNHDNIARLIDGGSTEEDCPYLVMEYVEGQRIDSFCANHTLSTAQRLSLFQTVCSAVQYAHQNLVVHRDLKPSNILITADGVPKLLDFGIAKIISPQSSDHHGAMTVTAKRRMTPQYASPEQIRGEAISTVSDVYSLGVILYELLTGHQPYRMSSGTPAEMEKLFLEQEPPKPSTAISQVVQTVAPDGPRSETLTPESVSKTRDGQPDQLRRRLAGDIDNIVLMAMRKEPERRYASAQQLSEDIRRHLDGLPVIARSNTFAYRASTFVKRNKTGVVAAVAIAIAILMGIVGITQQRNQAVANLVRAREAEQLAGAEAARAKTEVETVKEVSEFLVHLFEVSDPSEARGNTVTVREILDKGATNIAEELRDQPAVQATMMNTIGTVYQQLGLFDKAHPLIEGALTIRRKLFGSEHLAVAESLHNVAAASHARGDYAAAEPLFREALAIRRKLLGNEDAEVAATLNGLAVLLRVAGRLAEAERLYREALVMRRKLLGDEHIDVAETLNNLGMLHHLKGEYVEAERLLRNALAMRRKLLGVLHPQVAESMNNLAGLLYAIQDFGAAESLLREQVVMCRALLGDEHPKLGGALHNLAFVLHAQGKHSEAEPIYRNALAMRRKLLGGEHPDVVFSLSGLGGLRMDEGDAAGAEPLFRESLEIRIKGLPKGHWMIADSESLLGLCLTVLERYEEAEPLLLNSFPVIKSGLGENHVRTQKALQRIVDLYEAWGKSAKAVEYRARMGATE